MKLTYKHSTNELPEVISNYFRDISAIHNVNLNYCQFGVKCAAVETWNETPNEIKTSMSIKAFRKKRLPTKPIADICLPSFVQDSSKPNSV